MHYSLLQFPNFQCSWGCVSGHACLQSEDEELWENMLLGTFFWQIHTLVQALRLLRAGQGLQHWAAQSTTDGSI